MAKLVAFADEAGQRRHALWTGGPTGELVEGTPIAGYQPTGRTVTIERPLAPIEPPNIFGIGLNYAAHAAEGKRDVPDKPLIFGVATTAVIGTEEAIVLPRPAPRKVDFEAELGVVIGRRCKDVPVGEALGYVGGYTCVNDVTARDCQKELDSQWTRAKGFDTFCPMGPCLVTPDEIDPTNLRVRSWLNGEPMQDATTADMIFPVAALVSYLSQQFTLSPGTLICTGTPSGVGFARDPRVFLQAGDVIEVEVEGIGRLRNPVRAAD